MKQKFNYAQNPSRPLPPEARSAVEMAAVWNCAPHQAQQRMWREGWRFLSYDDTGQEVYLPPEK